MSEPTQSTPPQPLPDLLHQRTPSPNSKKRTPRNQPEDHPTPSRTKKVRQSDGPIEPYAPSTTGPTQIESPDSAQWTTVNRRKQPKRGKMPKFTKSKQVADENDNPPAEMTDPLGNTIPTGPLETTQPTNALSAAFTFEIATSPPIASANGGHDATQAAVDDLVNATLNDSVITQVGTLTLLTHKRTKLTYLGYRRPSYKNHTWRYTTHTAPPNRPKPITSRCPSDNTCTSALKM